MLAETYLIATTDQIDTSVQSMQDCISDVKTWMTSNKLKLNDDKTECLLIVSNRKGSQHKK